ncbi:hypothetical protein CBR_g6722 [Chara braunii]|uniref:Uncharacterized protein n=1 Tax=Chara braunii TaxID=69332 RepID=A0A388KKM2_CHABU|nr:hypothetical protein CBR_g6722 [Chara braunii]|eukprot:GBG70596.1 hypothetical protein CBR_g6722 [Chara braunii]
MMSTCIRNLPGWRVVQPGSKWERTSEVCHCKRRVDRVARSLRDRLLVVSNAAEGRAAAQDECDSAGREKERRSEEGEGGEEGR